MPVLQAIAGIVLIFMGRKMFWLFTGAVGFFVTFNLANRFLNSQPEWVILLIAATAGLAGSLLAVFAQSLAVGIASFLAGGYYFTSFLDSAGVDLGPFSWFLFAAGGLAAGFLAVFLFEWALIILSSVAGAALVSQAAGLEPGISALVFFTLFLFGLGIQTGTLRWEEQRQNPS